MRIITEQEIKLCFALLRSAVCNDIFPYDIRAIYNAELLPKIIKTAEQHDILHLIAFGLKKNNLLVECNKHLETEIFRAVYRYVQQNCELNKLCNTFEKAKIPFLPLKGSVIRKYYPEPWMRTACDIDVLVHTEDLDGAIDFLAENLKYKCKCENSHDVSMFSKSGIHIELHYQLIEEGLVNATSNIFKSIWHVAKPISQYNYCNEMPDEMFYFYHIAHMAKHFINGGCGIRPFLDLWVLNHRIDFDKERRDKLLVDGGLNIFAKQAELLSEVWFGNSGHTEITKQMETYILCGGVYGTNENRIAVQQTKKGGKLRYALSKIFISYDVIKFHYPIIQKHKLLTPIMEVRRWGKLIFCGHLKRTTKELKFNNNVSKKTAFETQELLKNIGL